jgi:uncharacterized protein YjbI with pentapeptide repeats
VERQRRRGVWVHYWPLLAVVVGGLVLGCVLVFPRLLYPPLSITELRARGVRDPKEQVQLQNDRLRLQNDARTTLLQAVGGLLVVTTAGAGAYTAWQQLQDNRRQQQDNEELSREQLQLSREQLLQSLDTSLEELRLTRESQITERFTRAVEQLGNKDALDVRLGGIYALERLAHDSPERDHPTVVEILSAFIRESSRRPRTPPLEHEAAQATAEKPDVAIAQTNAQPRPATDVQAALTVLGRLPQRSDVSRGDLSGAWLVGAQLANANLSGAKLDGADLSGAQLANANLSGAKLDGAKLSDAQLDEANLWGARLDGADLSGAQLGEADLSGAELRGADLSGAWLRGAKLPGAELGEAELSRAQLGEAKLPGAELGEADLSGAWLRWADLSGADLVGADLSGARLDGANLTETVDLRQQQVDAAHGNAETRLPNGMSRPTSWTGADSAQAYTYEEEGEY